MSEQAKRRANGPVLTSGFLVILDHSALVFPPLLVSPAYLLMAISREARFQCYVLLPTITEIYPLPQPQPQHSAAEQPRIRTKVLSHSLVHSLILLAPLTHSLAPRCTIHSRALLRSFVRSLAHELVGKLMIACLNIMLFCPIAHWQELHQRPLIEPHKRTIIGPH